MKCLIVFVVFQIRGMSIDEALKQLSFVERKGSAVVKEVRSLLSLNSCSSIYHSHQFR